MLKVLTAVSRAVYYVASLPRYCRSCIPVMLWAFLGKKCESQISLTRRAKSTTPDSTKLNGQGSLLCCNTINRNICPRHRLHMMGRLASLNIYRLQGIRGWRVSENGFLQIDRAGSSQFHELCELGILYTNMLLRQSKRRNPDRTRCTQILETRTRTAVSNEHVLSQFHKTEPNEQTGRGNQTANTIPPRSDHDQKKKRPAT